MPHSCTHSMSYTRSKKNMTRVAGYENGTADQNVASE